MDPKRDIETPSIVIDVERVRMNLSRMQEATRASGCALRPHIKTHKMIAFAKQQVAMGASGITCAKLSEAEIMADGGITDIFIAYPQVGIPRLKRLAKLNRRLKRLIVGVDSLTAAEALSLSAIEHDTRYEVRLEIDTGARRTGVSLDEAADLAEAIHSLPNLKLTGIYTFKSLVYQGQQTTDIKLAAEEEATLMSELAARIHARGITLRDISAGSTPTGLAVAGQGLINEIRPGTYIFYDEMCRREGVCDGDDIAVRIYCTVVSTPDTNLAVIDGGTKTFPMDIQIDEAPYYYPAYAIVEGREDLRLLRMNEEHGMLTSTNGQVDLQVGDVLALIPIHVCPAINLQNQVYLLDGDQLTLERVDARGALT